MLIPGVEGLQRSVVHRAEGVDGQDRKNEEESPRRRQIAEAERNRPGVREELLEIGQGEEDGSREESSTAKEETRKRAREG